MPDLIRQEAAEASSIGISSESRVEGELKAQAAFEGLPAASLVKSTRLMNTSEWMVGIFKATWKHFACTLAVVILGGLILRVYFPEAHRLPDIIKKG